MTQLSTADLHLPHPPPVDPKKKKRPAAVSLTCLKHCRIRRVQSVVKGGRACCEDQAEGLNAKATTATAEGASAG